MNFYTVLPQSAPIDWSRIPAARIDTLLWSAPTDITAEARVCYDEDALYVCLAATEGAIRAENRDPLDQPCEDSCLEFFFSPEPGDSRYFNFEFNLNCCMFLGLGSHINDLVRLLPLEEDLFAPEAHRTETGWQITYRIPHEFVRRFFPAYAPAPGKQLRANFYKCGDLTEQEHYLSWNPVTSEEPCFHRPQDFGTLILG